MGRRVDEDIQDIKMMRYLKLRKRNENAQGMVEFALILPILLLLVIGIVEFGRLLFFYSSITSASREAARYGSAVGEIGGTKRYSDCDGIRNAARRAGTFANLEDTDITIEYDDGTTVKAAACPPSARINLADRIVISVSKEFQPIVAFVNIPFNFPVNSTTARTIIKEVGVKGTPVPTELPPGQPWLTAEKIYALTNDADGNGYPSPGDRLQYSIAIVNAGTGNATNVVFSDTPDSNTTLANGSVTTGQGSVTNGNSTGDTSVSVALGTVAAGNTVTISFNVIINSPLSNTVTEVSNQGSVSSTEFSTILTDDPTTSADADPTETLLTYLLQADAYKNVTIQDDADNNGVASPGDTLRYVIAINNTGTGQLTSVDFDDNPDSNTTLVVGSVQSTTGTATNGNGSGDSTVSVNIGDMFAGAIVGITFDVTINANLPTNVTQVSNQGVVSSNELSDILTDDPDIGGDSDPTVISIVVINTPTPTTVTTAVPTSTPTFTPTPTNTPVPICGLEFRDFQQPSDRKITWDLFNNPDPGVLPVTIMSFQLSFPGSKLNQVDFGGVTIWDGPPASPIVTINTADWEGSVADRYLGVGEEKTFTLHFNNDMPAVGYSILIITDNCVDPVSASQQ